MFVTIRILCKALVSSLDLVFSTSVVIGEFLGADCLGALSFLVGIVGILRNSPTTPSICKAKLTADVVD